MAKIFYNKIKYGDGSYTIDNVPVKWRAAVQAMLDADED